jgi:hypothetical protein
MVVSGSSKRTRTLIVDGESFAVTVSGPRCHFAWLTGPNPGYGSTTTAALVGGGNSAERSAMSADLFTDEALTSQIRDFLRDIDPTTGYLRD